MSLPAIAVVFVFFLCSGAIAASPGDVNKNLPFAKNKIPRPDHIVIVIEENKSYNSIISNVGAKYINSLAHEGALFTESFAVSHPSEPNYLALFSGSPQGVQDDQCPISVSGDNLANQLLKNGLSFGIYSESMPSVGYEGCFSADNFFLRQHKLYARKHNPVVNWQGKNVPPEVNMPFDMFPSDYTKLPSVSLVIPNQINDMHSGKTQLEEIIHGDVWLKRNLDSYVQWARINNGLLIITWDEDDGSGNNRILTIFVGPMVKPGEYKERIDHYSILRTIEEMYGLPLLGMSRNASPITAVWK